MNNVFTAKGSLLHNKVGSPPELSLLDWQLFKYYSVVGIYLVFMETEKISILEALCLDPTCRLQPLSFRCGYWQVGRREKPQYYTSSCSNFSSLLLKWCWRCCKPETELIMNKVNRSQDPILPGITLKWLCAGIVVLKRKRNPRYLLFELGLPVSNYYALMCFPCCCSVRHQIGALYGRVKGSFQDN